MGLTKREYFAAQALAGICANQLFNSRYPQDAALAAVRCADALIKSLDRITAPEAPDAED